MVSIAEWSAVVAVEENAHKPRAKTAPEMIVPNVRARVLVGIT